MVPRLPCQTSKTTLCLYVRSPNFPQNKHLAKANFFLSVHIFSKLCLLHRLCFLWNCPAFFQLHLHLDKNTDNSYMANVKNNNPSRLKSRSFSKARCHNQKILLNLRCQKFRLRFYLSPKWEFPQRLEKFPRLLSPIMYLEMLQKALN